MKDEPPPEHICAALLLDTDDSDNIRVIIGDDSVKPCWNAGAGPRP